MKTLFDLERLANRLDTMTKDNTHPFLCCLDCGESIEVWSKRLMLEMDKIPGVVCHKCHSTRQVWDEKKPSQNRRFELIEKRMHALALQVETLRVSQGLQSVEVSKLVPDAPAMEALSTLDSLLAKPARLSEESAKL